MKQRIIFVCTGNICRSPAAHGILEHMAAREGMSGAVTVDSAGTHAYHAGELPDPRMRRAASARGYALTHRARMIEESDFFGFDAIIVMDDINYEKVCRLAPERRYLDKVHRMSEFLTGFGDWTYIPDPYYEGADGFELVLDMLENGCANILGKIKANGRNFIEGC